MTEPKQATMPPPKYPVHAKYPQTEDCKLLRYGCHTAELNPRTRKSAKASILTNLENVERIAAKWRAQGFTVNIWAYYIGGYAF